MSKEPKPFIAIAYDFDGTLSPRPMQEYTVFKNTGINPEEFWAKVAVYASQHYADPMLSFLRMMIEELAAQNIPLTREILTQGAEHIEYYNGVMSWFDRINQYVARQSENRIQVRHYIISCGNREIIEKSAVAPFFHRIYASSFYYNADGVATFPDVAVNDVTKTQFLFRINKGREELSESVNEHMPMIERPVPFKHILYIGDGLTDVPCMAVTRQNGGHAIAVYDANNSHAQMVCRKLWEAGRADFDAVADYTEGSLLDQRIKLILDLKIANIRMELEHPSHGGARF